MANRMIVQHVEPELSWAIGAALVRAGTRTDVRRTFAGDSVAPDSSGYEGVVAMGGPRWHRCAMRSDVACRRSVCVSAHKCRPSPRAATADPWRVDLVTVSPIFLDREL
jgi:hypothetical protein